MRQIGCQCPLGLFGKLILTLHSHATDAKEPVRGTEMNSMQTHPRLSDPDVPPTVRRSMLVRLKTLSRKCCPATIHRDG